MSLDDVIRQNMSEWMRGVGPESDVVIGSRTRLARNLERVPFPASASDDQLKVVLDAAERATRTIDSRNDKIGKLEMMKLAEMSPLARQLLVERHLISPQHAQHVKHKAVILRADEAISVLVNEEDHFRIQTLFPGLQLRTAYDLCSKVDDAFESILDFAFSETRGYLTACPTNVGTGLRASVMIHLPALAATGQIKKVIPAITQFGLAVRGLYGEGTEVVGNIYQVSNQVTLGHSEEEIIQHVVHATSQVISYERNARKYLLQEDKTRIEDQVWRSYGILSNARTMSSHEALQLLSDVRLGIDLGLIPGLQPRILQELLVLIRPAHLQKIMGKDMDAPERDISRATLIRERIRTTTATETGGN